MINYGNSFHHSHDRGAYLLKTFFKWGLLVLFTLVGIFLLGNINKAFIKIDPARLQVSMIDTPTVQQVSDYLPGSAIVSEKDKILSIPFGKFEEYAARAKELDGVWAARPVFLEKPEISFKYYWFTVKTMAHDYLNGDFGSITGSGNWEIPIGEAIKGMVERSFSYLIPGLLLGLFAAFVLSLFASLSHRTGKMLDGIHTLILGVPDYVLVTALTLMSIYFYKLFGIRLFHVAAFGDVVPFILPVLSIAFVPGVLIYGTLRLAMQRELGQDYVVTAKAKGLSQIKVLLFHVLRNVVDDLLTIMPKATNLALGSMVIAEAFCDILGLGGMIVTGKLMGASAMPLSCLVLAVISILFHTIYALLRKRLVVRIREVA